MVWLKILIALLVFLGFNGSFLTFVAVVKGDNKFIPLMIGSGIVWALVVFLLLSV